MNDLAGISIYPAWSEQPCIVCLNYPPRDTALMQTRGMVWLCEMHFGALKDHPLVATVPEDGTGGAADGRA